MDNCNSNQLDKDNKKLREALTQVLYQNEMMLGWVNGSVLTVDREGMVLSVNEFAQNSLGCTEEELVGKQCHSTFHHTLEDGGEYPWDFCPLFAAIEDGSSHHVTEDIFWKSDGTSISVDYIVSPVRDEKNNISGATLIFRNLTEMKLQEAKKIHGTKLESIGELSAGIAHEINTPIQFIGSNISFFNEVFQDTLELIQLYGEFKKVVVENGDFQGLVEQINELEEDVDVEYLIDEVPRAIEQTSSGVESVSELVRGLKGFAHSSDKSEKVAADINDIINTTLVVCRNAYKYVASLELELGDLPDIKVHHSDIGQVVMNLVVNASQAIEDAKGDSDELGCIKVKSFADDNHVIISISDTGGGIPELVEGRIFDPFFTTKEVGRGSGQGLAISRNIIHEKHGGDLRFESQPGVGTTFFIKLPVHQ